MTTIKQAENYLFSFLPKEVQYKFPGDFGLKRTKYLLSLLDSPQEKIKVVHIAGTSGKGSTAFYLSKLLHSHGKKVGLHLSPHLVDIRERFQINNNLISEQTFCKYLNELQPALQKIEHSSFGKPTYFEVTVALAYYTFWKEQVDYAVIETGLGGLYDGTNVVDNPSKVAVITRIGHDHMEVLGKTLAKIAFQKAGIIHPGNAVITIKQHKNALSVIQKRAKAMQSKLIIAHHLSGVQLQTTALYQLENASLSFATLAFLSKRDGFAISKENVRTVLEKSQFSGRMETITYKKRKVVLDGAHNPQKMSAFLKSLKKQFPEKKFDFLFAVKKGKDYKDMLLYIIPLSDSITITQFSSQKQGFSLASESSETLKAFLKHKVKKIATIDNPLKAFEEVIKTSKNTVVVTGSLYLLSELYSNLPLRET
jgi:dihydrofolate synthase/folylpolyglutamate synthase